jgi:hypothetical protein
LGASLGSFKWRLNSSTRRLTRKWYSPHLQYFSFLFVKHKCWNQLGQKCRPVDVIFGIIVVHPSPPVHLSPALYRR